MGKQLKSHPATWKFKVVLESFSTNHVAATARKYGIHPNQLSRLSQLLSGARAQHFSNRCQQTRARTRKAGGDLGATAGQEGDGDPPCKKVLGCLRPARWHLAQYARALVAQGAAGVNQVCRLLGSSKKSYYHSQAPDERLAQKYQALRPVLDRGIERHASYGLPGLKKALAEQEGLVVNAKLLRKLLRLWGLHGQRKAGAGQHQPRWVHQILGELGDKANLVRQIQITACFQVLVTAMTQLRSQAGIA